MKIFLKILVFIGFLKPYIGSAEVIKSLVPQSQDKSAGGGGGDRPSASTSGCIKC